MRSTDQRRVDFFTPDVPPSDVDELPTWLHNQMSNLAKAVSTFTPALHVERMYKYPEGYKPREGDIILAAAGLDPSIIAAGLYYFTGDTWKLIA